MRFTEKEIQEMNEMNEKEFNKYIEQLERESANFYKISDYCQNECDADFDTCSKCVLKKIKFD